MLPEDVRSEPKPCVRLGNRHARIAAFGIDGKYHVLHRGEQGAQLRFCGALRVRCKARPASQHEEPNDERGDQREDGDDHGKGGRAVEMHGTVWAVQDEMLQRKYRSAVHCHNRESSGGHVSD